MEEVFGKPLSFPSPRAELPSPMPVKERQGEAIKLGGKHPSRDGEAEGEPPTCPPCSSAQIPAPVFPPLLSTLS